MNFFEVAQHAGQDIAGRCGLQIKADGRLVVSQRPIAAPVGLQALSEVFPAERLARHRVNHHLALGQTNFDHEMPRKSHAMGFQAQPGGEFEPDHGQGNRDAPAGAHHRAQEAVVGVVVIVEVGAKAQVLVKKLVQGAQALQCGGIAGDPTFEAGEQLVYIGKHLGNIGLWVFVLHQRGRSFEQGEAFVAADQGLKIGQRRGNLKIHLHASLYWHSAAASTGLASGFIRGGRGPSWAGSLR